MSARSLVMVIAEMMTSNFLAYSAGIMPFHARVDDLGLHAELADDVVDDVGVVADDLAVLEEFVRHIGRFRADDQSAALLHLVERVGVGLLGGRKAQQDRRTGAGQQCASFHEAAPGFVSNHPHEATGVPSAQLARYLLPLPASKAGGCSMASKRLHLGWFMNFTPGEWDHPLATGGSDWNGRFYVDMAQSLERACFDYIRPVATCRPDQRGSPRGWNIVATLSTLAPIRPSCWHASAQRSTTSPMAASAGTSSPPARMPRRRISAWTGCRRTSSATRWPTNTLIWSASFSIRGTRMPW